MDIRESMKRLAKELEELSERIINSDLPYHLKEPYINNKNKYKNITNLVNEL